MLQTTTPHFVTLSSFGWLVSPSISSAYYPSEDGGRRALGIIHGHRRQNIVTGPRIWWGAGSSNNIQQRRKAIRHKEKKMASSADDTVGVGRREERPSVRCTATSVKIAYLELKSFRAETEELMAAAECAQRRALGTRVCVWRDPNVPHERATMVHEAARGSRRTTFTHRTASARSAAHLAPGIQPPAHALRILGAVVRATSPLHDKAPVRRRHVLDRAAGPRVAVQSRGGILLPHR